MYGRTNSDNIAVHNAAHRRSYKTKSQIFGRRERHGKTETVFVRLDTAFDQIQFVRQRKPRPGG